MLLLAAAVVLPCAVLYRAAVSNTTPPVQVAWDPRTWWEWDRPPPPVMFPEPEEDGDLNPIAAGDLVRFSLLLLVNVVNFSSLTQRFC